MKISGKLYTLLGILFVCLLGTLSHFVYQWTGNNPVVGLLVPTSESTWEHMKLLFFPVLLFIPVSSLPGLKVHSCREALLSSNILCTLLIPVLFYTYSGILGFHMTAVDIGIFYLCTVLVFLLPHSTAFTLFAKKFFPAICAVTFLLALGFFFFTFRAPGIALFQTP